MSESELDNKRNMQYFTGASMQQLYDNMNSWQEENRKRLLSLSIQKDGDVFCCIALTNPTEVTIVDIGGSHHACVNRNGALLVYSE